jgi:hypothetical protein
MLTKRKLAANRFRVTFTMPPLEAMKQLCLAGDFSEWNVTATPMQCQADETWRVTLTMVGGCQYEYRYLADSQTWHDDRDADAHAPNPFGSENAVLDLTPSGLSALVSEKKKASRKR